MTDEKMNENELLVQSFFADMRMEEIPDDGFSDRVMAALPPVAEESYVARRRRLEHLWTAVCVGIGILAAVLCQGWEVVQAFLSSTKIDCVLAGARILVDIAGGVMSIWHNLWMVLAGMAVMAMVWAYNVLADSE